MQFTNALGNAQISTVINEALALLNTIKTTAIATSSATARHKRQQQAQVAKNYQKELSIITQQTQKILAEELRQLNLPNNWWKDLALTSLSKSSIPLQKLDVSCLSALSASSRTASPYSQKAATLGYSYIQPIFNSYSHQRLPKFNVQQMRNFRYQTRPQLDMLESRANSYPQDADIQAEYLRAMVVEDPPYVIRRCESGLYATNGACQAEYVKALRLTGRLPREDMYAGSEQQLPIGRESNQEFLGSENNPVSVVTQQRKGTFFKEQVWNTIRFLIGMVLILSLIEAQLQMKMSKQKEIMPDMSEKKYRFTDVQGVDEAKQELQDIVDFLKDPEKYKRLGGRLPTGILLIGPPGTGKTLLARAVAGEAGVPFFFCSGSEFDEMFVGVGAARVRNLFAAAKEHSPCIVFIDELDAIGGTRVTTDHQPFSRMTLNQLLVELDGFEKTDNIVIIGATNFPEVLDKALVRPGRFDSRISVPLPDVRGRREILKYYLGKVPTADNVDAAIIARGTVGFSGADLSNLVNQAAIKAALTSSSLVSMDHLEFAKDKIIMGPERKNATIEENNRRLVAFHESGHALVALYTRDALPVHKATIMPRGSALGMVTQLPEKDELSWSKKQLLARLDVCMGGRVAEELIFGDDSITSGAASDVQQATEIAKAMVAKYAMSEKAGLVHYHDKNSPEAEAMIENEVRQLIKDAYERARNILKTHSTEHKRLAEALLRYETLNLEEIKTVIQGKSLKRDG